MVGGEDGGAGYGEQTVLIFDARPFSQLFETYHSVQLLVRV